MSDDGVVRVERVAGTGIALRGDDIDTDRIIPARFLVAVTFEGLEAHAFADDRKAETAAGRVHPFDDPSRRGAGVLVVNGNFGCGSSREHAPQALHRRGIRAVLGASFSAIFAGNALAMGLPCASLAPDDVAALQDAVEKDPTLDVALDVRAGEVRAGGRTFAASLPAPTRDALLTGGWDATGLLLERFDEVRAAASRLPYVAGF